MSTGIYLQLRIGKTGPSGSLDVASKELINALQSAEVILSEDGKDGFELVFAVGQNNAANVFTFEKLQKEIAQFNRVIISVIFGVIPKVLMDGVIVLQQFNPSSEPGKSTLTVKGEGLDVLMDLIQIQCPPDKWKGQSDDTIVSTIIGEYSKYKLTAKVASGETKDTRVQTNMTDLEFIKKLAEDNGFVFYIEPDNSGSNIAYFGPAKRAGVQPQKPLLFNMAAHSNVKKISLSADALKTKTLEGNVQDPETGDNTEVPKSDQKQESKKFGSVSLVRKFKVQGDSSGKKIEDIYSKALAQANEEAKKPIIITGELDTIRYGDVLRARQIVKLQGLGEAFNDEYYVKKVQHTISRGSYNQNFTLRCKTPEEK